MIAISENVSIILYMKQFEPVQEHREVQVGLQQWVLMNLVQLPHL